MSIIRSHPVSYLRTAEVFEKFFTAFFLVSPYSFAALEKTTAPHMQKDNNNPNTPSEATFCRLAWITGALEAARRHHDGKSQDELTAFGLINPAPALHVMDK